MFKICKQPTVQFNSQTQIDKKIKSISVATQTTTRTTSDKEVQSLTVKDESVQVNLERDLRFEDKLNFNETKLLKFLNYATDIIIKEIKESILIEKNLKFIELMNDNKEDLICDFYYSAKKSNNLKDENLKQLKDEKSSNEDENLEIQHLIWSFNQNQLIIGFSVKDHSCWCTHKSRIEFCNLYKRSENRPNLLKTIFQIEIKNCITQLIAHPTNFNQLAVGTKAGIIQIIDRDLTKLDEKNGSNFIKHESNLHKLEITFLSFKKSSEISYSSANSLDKNITLYDELISCSLDGMIILWKIKKLERKLQPIKVFSLSKKLFKQIQLGIKCACLSPEEDNLLIGCEKYLFSTQISKSKTSSNELNVDFEYDAHKGEIKNIEFNFSNSSLFLTNGTDGEVRLYEQNLRNPLLVIYLDKNQFIYKWIYRTQLKSNKTKSNYIIGLNGENNFFNLVNIYKKDTKYFTSNESYALKDAFKKLFINQLNQLALINLIDEIYLFDLNAMLKN